MHFLQENGSLSQKCMKTENYRDSIYLPHLINPFIAQTPCWWLFMCTKTFSVCRHMSLLSNVLWSNLFSGCCNDLWKHKNKVSLHMNTISTAWFVRLTFHLWLICAFLMFLKAFKAAQGFYDFPEYILFALCQESWSMRCSLRNKLFPSVKLAEQVCVFKTETEINIEVLFLLNHLFCSPLSNLWKFNHWRQYSKFPVYTGEYWAKTRRILLGAKYI